MKTISLRLRFNFKSLLLTVSKRNSPDETLSAILVDVSGLMSLLKRTIHDGTPFHMMYLQELNRKEEKNEKQLN